MLLFSLWSRRAQWANTAWLKGYINIITKSASIQRILAQFFVVCFRRGCIVATLLFCICETVLLPHYCFAFVRLYLATLLFSFLCSNSIALLVLHSCDYAISHCCYFVGGVAMLSTLYCLIASAIIFPHYYCY